MQILSLRRHTSERISYTLFSALVGCSGWAAASAGVLFLTWGYVHKEGAAPWYLNLAAAVLGIVVPLLFLVGLAGLAGVYVKCRTRVGWPSLIGFVVTFAAAGWFTVMGIQHAPIVYSELDGRNQGHGVGLECGFCLLQKLSLLLNSPLTWLLAGLTIVGLTTLRKEALKGWGYLLVAMVLFGWVHQLSDAKTGIIDARSVHVVFGMLLSLSWMLLGYALWSADKLIYTTKTGSLVSENTSSRNSTE